MTIGKTLFAQVLEFVPWKNFSRIIGRHGGDAGVKTLSCADLFRIMAFSQLTWRESLPYIEVCLTANRAKLYHMDAAKDLNITSTADTVHITAKNNVLVNGGGSFTEWSANGIKSGTNGTWTEHAAAHTSLGPLSRPVELPELPNPSPFEEQFRFLDELGNPLPNIAYTISSACGKTWKGITDANGMSQRVSTKTPSSLAVHLN